MTEFLNEYTCPQCGCDWEDRWDAMCDDMCPDCGLRAVQPHHSKEVDREGGAQPSPALREARIICPMFGEESMTSLGFKSRAPLDDIHSELEGRLLEAFTGFTKYYGSGGYVYPADGEIVLESVVIYDVAVWPKDIFRLTSIARWLLVAADQTAIYLRYPDGTVAIVTEEKDP